MTLRLRCIRCGDWEDMSPLDVGLCCNCWLFRGKAPPHRWLRWQNGMETHPTHKALVAALEDLERVPHGSLVESPA